MPFGVPTPIAVSRGPIPVGHVVDARINEIMGNQRRLEARQQELYVIVTDYDANLSRAVGEIQTRHLKALTDLMERIGKVHETDRVLVERLHRQQLEVLRDSIESLRVEILNVRTDVAENVWRDFWVGGWLWFKSLWRKRG